MSKPAVLPSLSSSFVGSLPSQEGKRGRPRKCGRVLLRPAPGADVLAYRYALADFYGCPLASVVHYTHKIEEGTLAFNVASIPSTEVHFLASSMPEVTESAPSDASEAAPSEPAAPSES